MTRYCGFCGKPVPTLICMYCYLEPNASVDLDDSDARKVARELRHLEIEQGGDPYGHCE